LKIVGQGLLPEDQFAGTLAGKKLLGTDVAYEHVRLRIRAKRQLCEIQYEAQQRNLSQVSKSAKLRQLH